MSGLLDLESPERSAAGRVIVLPGIEGRSRWNRGIVQGLVAAGVPYAIEIHDWTYGRLLAPVSLLARRRHREQAEIVAAKVAAAKSQHPQAPVWLIGHSGGGGIALLTLERLPAEVRVEGAILLAPAVSPRYDLRPALSATQRGLWNFYSWGDALFLMAGTLLLGTIDGRHTIAAGACGFAGRPPAADGRSPEGPELTQSPRLTEVAWRPEMAQDWNLAGHFGPVHPRFVRNWVAPILVGAGAERGETAPADTSRPRARST